MNSEIEKSYFKMSIPDLIELLLSYRKKEIEFDQEKFDALLNHFKTRHLTTQQRILVQRIVRSDVESLQSEQFHNQKSNIENNLSFKSDKYPGLRIISKISKFFAFLIALICFVAIMYSFMLSLPNALISSVIVFVVGGIFTLSLLALSESIMVIIDIEENTRMNGSR